MNSIEIQSFYDHHVFTKEYLIEMEKRNNVLQDALNYYIERMKVATSTPSFGSQDSESPWVLSALTCYYYNHESDALGEEIRRLKLAQVVKLFEQKPNIFTKPTGAFYSLVADLFYGSHYADYFLTSINAKSAFSRLNEHMKFIKYQKVFAEITYSELVVKRRELFCQLIERFKNQEDKKEGLNPSPIYNTTEYIQAEPKYDQPFKSLLAHIFEQATKEEMSFLGLYISESSTKGVTRLHYPYICKQDDFRSSVNVQITQALNYSLGISSDWSKRLEKAHNLNPFTHFHNLVKQPEVAIDKITAKASVPTKDDPKPLHFYDFKMKEWKKPKFKDQAQMLRFQNFIDVAKAVRVYTGNQHELTGLYRLFKYAEWLFNDFYRIDHFENPRTYTSEYNEIINALINSNLVEYYQTLLEYVGAENIQNGLVKYIGSNNHD